MMYTSHLKRGLILANYVVTGGAGFVGSNLVDKLALDPDNQVIVIDDFSTGNPDFVPKKPNVKFIKCDVNNTASLKKVFPKNIDYLYHYAAVVGVQRTLQHPLKVLRDIDGFRNILDLAKKGGAKRIFFASSSEVYGEPVEMPQHEETTPLNSRLPYAVVKNVGESYIRSYQQEYGLNFTIFRFFNTYGPRQSTDFVMSKFLAAALKNQDIPVYGEGHQTRTFCYIDDNVETTANAINDKSTINKVINIGNDQETRIVDLADLIIKLTDSKSRIGYLPPLKEGDMTRRQPDAAKMKKLLGRPMTDLSSGIKKLLEYQKLNRDMP